jgi:hypothetical protein
MLRQLTSDVLTRGEAGGPGVRESNQAVGEAVRDLRAQALADAGYEPADEFAYAEVVQFLTALKSGR